MSKCVTSVFFVSWSIGGSFAFVKLCIACVFTGRLACINLLLKFDVEVFLSEYILFR